MEPGLVSYNIALDALVKGQVCGFGPGAEKLGGQKRGFFMVFTKRNGDFIMIYPTNTVIQLDKTLEIVI